LLRRLAKILAVAAVVYLTFSLFLGVFLMEGALHLKRVPVLGQGAFAQSVAALSGSGVENARQTASDGTKLSGWYVQPDEWNGDSVILLHGVGDNREGMTSYARMFLGAGYAVLLPDARGHGESGGDLSTYGLLESGDVRDWSGWLAARKPATERSNPKSCLYLFGESMGAAIALQATAVTPHLCAVAAEDSFASFREIGYVRVAQGLGSSIGFSHVFAWPTVNFAFLYARVRDGLDFGQASPELDLAQSRVPSLLIAGADDANIPPWNSQRIAKRAGSAAELWLVPGAGHTLAARVAPVAFRDRVLDWFRRHTQVIR
jgi:alpha-beta hydrolase superfamily lysophospholipase